MAHNTTVRPVTTIAAGSNGVSLPTGTVNVADSSGFPGSGTITVVTDAGPQTVHYTGTGVGSSFSGCTGGTGTMSTGGSVYSGWRTITRAEIASLDTGLRSAINGVDGSTHAPASQIVVSGSGGGGMLVTGPTQVKDGGVLTIDGAFSVQLNDNDYPIIDPVGNPAHAFQTRVIPGSMARGAAPYHWHARREDGGIQAWSAMFDASDGAGMRPAIARMRLRPHDAGTITSVNVAFRVSTPHSALPSTMPAARVYAVGPNGNFLLLTSASAGADTFGYVYVPTPSSPAAWFASGGTQFLTIPCDQNNVVNAAAYDYIVELVDEQGLTGWPWQIVYLAPVHLASGASLPRFGSVSVDGSAVVTGDRILLFAQADGSQNGIWIANTSGYWSRAPDWNQSSQFSRGMVIPVTSGTTLGGLYFQTNTLYATWSRGTSPDSATAWSAGASLASFGGAAIPTSAHANGSWFTGVGTGTPVTGGSEPTWPSGIGSTVVDNAGANQITWTNAGSTPTAIPFGLHPDVSNADDSLGQFVAHGTIWQAVRVNHAGIPDFRPQ